MRNSRFFKLFTTSFFVLYFLIAFVLIKKSEKTFAVYLYFTVITLLIIVSSYILYLCFKNSENSDYVEK